MKAQRYLDIVKASLREAGHYDLAHNVTADIDHDDEDYCPPLFTLVVCGDSEWDALDRAMTLAYDAVFS